MKLVSLFSGCGGLDYGFEKGGIAAIMDIFYLDVEW